MTFMNNEAIKAVMHAANVNPRMARRILERLEVQGMAVYKKKVFKNGRRPNSSQSVTRKLAEKIYNYFRQNPDETQQSIANKFNVNIGRVNEVIDRAENKSEV